MDNKLKLLAVAGGALVVVACQSPTPRNISLEQARFIYHLTLSDPFLAEHAAAELKQARRTLRAAERVWSDGGDPATTRTLARMAAQQVELARASALAFDRPDAHDIDDAVNMPLREAAGRDQGARPQPVTVSRSAAQALDPVLRTQPEVQSSLRMTPAR